MDLNRKTKIKLLNNFPILVVLNFILLLAVVVICSTEADISRTKSDWGNRVFQNVNQFCVKEDLFGSWLSPLNEAENLANEYPVKLNYTKDQLADNVNFNSKSESPTIEPNNQNVVLLPVVLLGLFTCGPTPFLARYFDSISNLDYPPKKLHVFLYNGTNHPENHAEIDRFLKSRSPDYASVTVVQFSEKSSGESQQIRKKAFEYAKDLKVDFYFYVESEARITNPATLKTLMLENKTVVSPFLRVPYETRSNYWGTVNSWGRPRRGLKYMDMINEELSNTRGLWSVPCVSSAYLVNVSAATSGQYTTSSQLCQTNGENTSFYLSTKRVFGHMVSTTKPRGFIRKNQEMYEVWNNRHDWELSYLHSRWQEAEKLMEEPCPDVFWFPLLSQKFCEELIGIMEDFGEWSTGTNYAPKDGSPHPNNDPFPTVDVDLRRVGLHPLWWEIVQSYVRPMQLKVLGGYDKDPFIDTSLVIRYRPEEQSSNQPHHDTSTYTINVALNKEFEGGGCKFIRQNCSVTEARVGWAIIHPGDLTHFHEGLATTKGTRYILVSFIDPRQKDID